MYSYLLRLALKDGSTVEIEQISSSGKKSIMNLIDESAEELDLLEEVSRVLYFNREKLIRSITLNIR